MLMHSFRKLILIWMILWLPASGAIAVVMPIAGMLGSTTAGKMSMSAVENAPDVGTVEAASPMPCHGKAASANGLVQTGGCSHCVLCHLAGALMLPSIPDLPEITPTHNFVATPALLHTSFFPEPTSPPPRSIAG